MGALAIFSSYFLNSSSISLSLLSTSANNSSFLSSISSGVNPSVTGLYLTSSKPASGSPNGTGPVFSPLSLHSSVVSFYTYSSSSSSSSSTSDLFMKGFTSSTLRSSAVNIAPSDSIKGFTAAAAHQVP